MTDPLPPEIATAIAQLQTHSNAIRSNIKKFQTQQAEITRTFVAQSQRLEDMLAKALRQTDEYDVITQRRIWRAYYADLARLRKSHLTSLQAAANLISEAHSNHPQTS